MSLNHNPTSYKVNAATNNIPTAFSTSVGSYLGNGLAQNRYKRMMVLNETAAGISVCTQPGSSPAPSNTTSTRVYIPATGYAAFDDYPVYDAVFIQSESGSAITTGTVEVQFW